MAKREQSDEFILRVLSTYGIGSEVKGQDERNPHFAPDYGTIYEIGKHKLTIDCGKNKPMSEFMSFEVKLLLRSVSNLKKKDAVEIAKIASSWDRAAPLDPNDVSEWLSEIMSGNCALTADYVSGNQYQQIADYLRSRKYMIPFMGIDLFEVGIAEEKNTEVSMQDEEKCPECGAEIIPKWSGGVKCSKCDWWFCY